MTENPQNREKLEDEILAFFDGALGPESTERLMETVETNPEARALFESHQSLQDLIASARVPLDTPVETTRALAEKIPNLLVFLPGLVGGLETLPVLTQSANTFMTFLAKVPASMMISAGAAVTVMTAAGVYVATTNNSTDKDHAKSAHVRVAEAPKQDNPMNFQPVQNAANTPEVGHTDATYKENALVGAAATASNANSNSTSAAVTPNAASTRQGSTTTPAQPTAHSASSNAASIASHPVAPKTIGPKAIASGEHANAVNAAKVEKTTNKAIAPRDIASIARSIQPGPISAKDIASNLGPNLKEVERAELPEPVISTATPRAAQQNLAPRSSASSSAHVIINEESSSSESVQARPFGAVGLRFLMLPNVSGVAPTQDSKSGFNGGYSDFMVGFDLRFTSMWGARIGFGSGYFGQVTPFVTPSNVGSLHLTQYTVGNQLSVIPAFYVKILPSLTLNPRGAFRVTAELGGGVAFPNSVASPLAQVGVRATYDIAPFVSVTGGVALEGAWIAMDSRLVTVQQGVNSILVTRSLDATSIFHTTLIPQITLSFRP